MKPTAIEALQIARKALEFVRECIGHPDNIEAIDKALSDTATLAHSSEPVAWYFNDEGRIEVSRVQRVGWEPLYTHPASSEAQAVPDIESAAKAIYRIFDLSDRFPWVEGGNSLMQDDARRFAIAAFSAAPTVPAHAETTELPALRSFVLEVSRQDPAQPTGQRLSNKERAEDLCEQWRIS